MIKMNYLKVSAQNKRVMNKEKCDGKEYIYFLIIHFFGERTSTVNLKPQ